RANALSTDRPSEWTRNTVNSWGLLRRFDDDPEGALGALREIVTSGRGASTELFALGELSFLHAEDTGKKPYYFAATVYMYAFLFPGERHDRPDELDPRTRLAVDFYNHAIARAFESRDGRTLDLYTASDAETVAVEGRTVPLEFEETATIASQLAESPIWKRELWGFLGRAETGDRLPVLASLTPYQRGRIPVVFVHGTASSPGRWADMVNDLLADPWIRHRCHFWFFMYDTGNPVAYSAMLLRDKLTDTVSRLDPDNLDPCLRQVVVVGHSRGGLLTKLTIVETGPRLWNSVRRVPLAGDPASDEFRTRHSRRRRRGLSLDHRREGRRPRRGRQRRRRAVSERPSRGRCVGTGCALFALDPIRAGDDPGDATHPARPLRRAGCRGSALRAS